MSHCPKRAKTASPAKPKTLLIQFEHTPISLTLSTRKDILALRSGARADRIDIRCNFNEVLTALVEEEHYFSDVLQLTMKREFLSEAVDADLLARVIDLKSVEVLRLAGVTAQECTAILDRTNGHPCKLRKLDVSLAESNEVPDFTYLSHPAMNWIKHLRVHKFPVTGPPVPRFMMLHVIHIDKFVNPATGEDTGTDIYCIPRAHQLREWFPSIRELYAPHNPSALLPYLMSYDYRSQLEHICTSNNVGLRTLRAIIPSLSVHEFKRRPELRAVAEAMLLSSHVHTSNAMTRLALDLCKWSGTPDAILEGLANGRIKLYPRYIMKNPHVLLELPVECATAVAFPIILNPNITRTRRDQWYWGRLRGALLAMLVRIQFGSTDLASIPFETVDLIQLATRDVRTGCWVASGILHAVLSECHKAATWARRLNDEDVSPMDIDSHALSVLREVCKTFNVVKHLFSSSVMQRDVLFSEATVERAIEDLVRDMSSGACRGDALDRRLEELAAVTHKALLALKAAHPAWLPPARDEGGG